MWTGEDGSPSIESRPVSADKTHSSPGENETNEPRLFNPHDINGTELSNSRRSIPGIPRMDEKTTTDESAMILPAERPFSIQIGWRQFKLSGASLMSDAPSYFSAYFAEQLRRDGVNGAGSSTLYIDRDPDTFADICRHLQGYHITPKDSDQFVRLYADAQFYNLPRLISQLFDADIYATIGGTEFRLSRDTFSGPGNTSNFFSLGFSCFLGTREIAFPGLESKTLMRPPPMPPQNVPNRSADIFRDLISLSRGYPLKIRDGSHRAQLLSDCKYYGLKGLMHRLFAHKIGYNPVRQATEIVMRLEDVYKSGVSYRSDGLANQDEPFTGGWVYYSRPFVDETSYAAIIEIGGKATNLDVNHMRAEFFGPTKARISSLFQTVADKMNLPSSIPLGLMMSSGGASAAPASPANSPLSEDRVRICIDSETHIVLDGDDYSWGESERGTSFDTIDDRIDTNPSSQGPSALKKRKRSISRPPAAQWIIKKGQWRIRVQPKSRTDGRSSSTATSSSSSSSDAASYEIVLWAVKLDALSGPRGVNAGRDWLD